MSIEKIKKLIEENQKFALITFSLTGIMYQVINLLSISTDSIKFFSVTSAISDSIIISSNFIILVLLIFTYRFITSILFSDFSLVLEGQKTNKVSRFFKKYNILVYVPLYIILISIDNHYHLAYIPYRILLAISFVTIFQVILFDLLPKWIKSLNNNLYFYLIVIGTVIVSPFILPKFNELYDSKILNIEEYEAKLIKEENLSSVKIKYYNDKYLFIVVKKNNSADDYLLIRKIDDIL